MAAHYPVNHQLRQTYRFIAALAGLYLVLVGVVGLARTWGDPFFHRGGDWALGLRTNPASALLSLLLGVIVVGAAVAGGNLHHRVNLVLGWALITLAMAVLTVIQTDVNVLNVSMVNVVVIATLGLVVLCAALYGKVEPVRD